MGTLYGRLREAGRIDRDAYEGIETYERLNDAWRRESKIARVPPRDFVTYDGKQVDLARLREDLDAAQAILRRVSPEWLQLVHDVMARETHYPSTWPIAYDAPLEKAGHALARHFGLRP